MPFNGPETRSVLKMSPMVKIEDKKQIKPEPEQRAFKVSIKGTRPLLMHDPMRSRAVNEQYEAGKIPPEVEAEGGLYKDPDGNIIIPSDNVLAMLFYAGADLKVGGKGKTTYKKFVKSGLSIEPFYVPFLSEEEWTIDARPAKVGKAQIMRHRPRFEKWGLKFTVNVIDPTFLDNRSGPEILRQILTLAGRRHGLGDNRPIYGLFSVESIEEAQ
jgi:hypothetical protein